MPALNATHDPALRSWVASANAPGCDFPIQNLPLGVFRRAGEAARGGVGIGDMILDLPAALARGLFTGLAAAAAEAASGDSLNRLMRMGNQASSALRAQLSDMLREGTASRAPALAAQILVPMAEAEMLLPAQPGSFTDFLTSLYHTERGGRRRNPAQPLPPAFKHLPVAYNSRASSVRISGEAVRRPNVQLARADGSVEFGPCEQQDFELELGLWVGPGNMIGEPIPLEDAEQHIFGYSLVNDWSSRDIQRWESQPLGPFLSKSLSTSVSPWVITSEALAPFRCPGPVRPDGDPAPLPYLTAACDQAEGGIDLDMDVQLLTPRMRQEGNGPAVICRTNFRHMYWTMGQMLTHHASNGCNLRPGDLIASGTCSGPTDDSRACMSEITAGQNPITLPNGETRLWLEDGDEVIFRARAARQGFAAIGFGECRGRIDPAPAWPKRG